jgi:hypothetical protein
MKQFNPRRDREDGPEAKIVKAVIKRLELLGWYVKILHMNVFTSGMPDLYITHKKYGSRLVEIKNRQNYRFTAAQLECFEQLEAHGSGVWVLSGHDDEEIAKLFKPSNWYRYLL